MRTQYVLDRDELNSLRLVAIELESEPVEDFDATKLLNLAERIRSVIGWEAD